MSKEFDIDELIEEARENFEACFKLENQGHESLHNALLACYKIIVDVDDEELEKLLLKQKFIQENHYNPKRVAMYILWLAIGKPVSPKNATQQKKAKIEKQNARLRMYARVLNKFIALQLSEDEADEFLDKYGVYAIANLNALKAGDNSNGKDNNNDDDDENENDENGKKFYWQQDRKMGFETVKSALSQKLHYKRCVIFKDDDGAIKVCRAKSALNKIIPYINSKKNNFKIYDIDAVIAENSND